MFRLNVGGPDLGQDANWFTAKFPYAGEWRLPLVETEARDDFPDGIASVLDYARSEPAPLQVIPRPLAHDAQSSSWRRDEPIRKRVFKTPDLNGAVAADDSVDGA